VTASCRPPVPSINNQNNQIVPCARDPRSADEDEEDAATLDTIACNIGLLSKRQAHLADMQVQAIHVAKGYIDDRVNSAEQQARSHAEVLGYALTQVQADHHVLREHLSVYLQAIADSARQQINHVYEDLQSRHVMNLHSYDQRVQEIDRETQATKDAVKANAKRFGASVQINLASTLLSASSRRPKRSSRVKRARWSSMPVASIRSKSGSLLRTYSRLESSSESRNYLPLLSWRVHLRRQDFPGAWTDMMIEPHERQRD
jgi:hypothetical protein